MEEEDERWKWRGGWETWWTLLEVEVKAELVSTIRPTAAPVRPRHTTESWSAEEPSTFRPGNRVSSLTPIPTPSPAPKPRDLVLSSVHRGGGLGFRGEVRMRAGFEVEESRVWG